MNLDPKSSMRDSEIDDILAQIKKKRGQDTDAPQRPSSTEDDIDAILQGFGLGGTKRSKTEPVLIPKPEGMEEEAPPPTPKQPSMVRKEEPVAPETGKKRPRQRQAAPTQPQEQVQVFAPVPQPPKKPVQIDVPIEGPVEQPLPTKEKGKKEPITVELPTIKSFTEAEAHRQERERQRIMNEAAREARNTIHNSAQFAVQKEVTRHLAMMREEKKENEDTKELTESDFDTYSGMRFGDVNVDEAFQDFFKKTVATDQVAVKEATGQYKNFMERLLQRFKGDDKTSAAAPEDDYDLIMPTKAKMAPNPMEQEELPPQMELNVAPVELQEGQPAKMNAADLAKAIANAQVEDLSPKGKNKRKVNVDVPLDNEIPVSEEVSQEAQKQIEMDEYRSLSDAPAVQSNLTEMRRGRAVCSVITGIIAAVLLYLGLMARAETNAIISVIDAKVNPFLFLLVNFVLLAIAALSSITTMTTGLLGIVREPSTDTFSALAVLAALVQNVAYLFNVDQFDAKTITLFAPIAVVLLFGNTVGKWLQMNVICKNFARVTSGAEHAAAFLMPQEQMVKRLCSGLGESDPQLLVSRPTALLRGFLRQSFSVRLNDAMAQTLSYVLMGAALVCAAICGFKGQGVMPAVSGFAAAICLGSPLASSLVYAVPSKLMQDYAGKYGAVIPGPSAVSTLGRANTVLLNANDLFPVGSVQLHGIKTFEKERIDIAILYAASMLAKNCATLHDIFLGIIQGNEKLLYPVESLSVETGFGLMGWIEHNRVIIGNRAMMRRHDVELPSMDYERKYTKNGQRAPIYLAVAGKLFGMFVVSYQPIDSARTILDRLAKNGTSVLVKSDDFNVTSQMVSSAYQIPLSTIKVLSQPECDALITQTGYRAESDGVMIHKGTCESFLGGMRAAGCAAEGERLARLVQTAAIALSAVFSLVLSFYAGLGGLALGAVLLYQVAWGLFTVAVPLSKRPS